MRKTAIAVSIAMSNNPHLPAALSNLTIWITPKAKIMMKKVSTAQGIYCDGMN